MVGLDWACRESEMMGTKARDAELLTDVDEPRDVLRRTLVSPVISAERLLRALAQPLQRAEERFDVGLQLSIALR